MGITKNISKNYEDLNIGSNEKKEHPEVDHLL